jgi:hypothetical protein
MKAADRSLRAHLFDILCRQFDLEELRTLCWILDVDYDSLRGEGKAAKARELIRYAQNRGLLLALVEEGRALRADVDWPDVSAPTAGTVPPPDRAEATGQAASLSLTAAPTRPTRAGWPVSCAAAD